MSRIWSYSSDVRLARTGLLLLMLVTLHCVTGCTRSEKWTEEVLLPDGRVVMLTRYQEFGRRHEIGQPAGPSFHWLTFKHPHTGETIRWEDAGDLGTVALFLVDDHVYLLTMTYYGSSHYDAHCPNPPYLLFEYDNAGWRQIDLTKIPLKRLRSNLTFSLSDEDIKKAGSKHHLSADQTQLSFYENKAWVMDFASLGEQTFGMKNCSHRLDYRILSERSSLQEKDVAADPVFSLMAVDAYQNNRLAVNSFSSLSNFTLPTSFRDDESGIEWREEVSV